MTPPSENAARVVVEIPHARIEGRAATMRILQWVQSRIPTEAHAGAVFALLMDGLPGDEYAAPADYAITRWERLDEVDLWHVSAYLVPVLEPPPIDVVAVREEWSRKYGGDHFAVVEFGS